MSLDQSDRGPEPIPPALTPEEWLESPPDRSGWDGEIYGLASSHSTETMTERMVQIIARANHNLPNDSPYKLTQADVDALLGAAPDEPRSVAAQMRTLAAKIAALLPPVVPSTPTE